MAHLFPDTDRRHVVLTPLRVYLAECLAVAPAWTLRDVACGLFTATAALRLHERAQRFFPEALVFLERALGFLLEHAPAADAPTELAVPDFGIWLAPVAPDGPMPDAFTQAGSR